MDDPTLEYANRSTPRSRRRRTSAVVAVLGLVVAGLGFVVAPPYVGSGIIRANPFSLLPALAVLALALVYVALRVEEDVKWPCFGLGLVAFGAVVAVVAVPVQVLIWREDPGTPQSRWRPELMWPLPFAIFGLLLAAIGRGLTRRCSRPPRREAAR
jgi:peptidoglycan/LPS O-acetylase OafA/YrhL